MQTKSNCKTISIPEVAEILGIGRSAAYALVNDAVKNPDSAPFRAVRIGGSLRVSRKSFLEYLERNDM